MKYQTTSCVHLTIIALAMTSALTACTYDASESTDPDWAVEATAQGVDEPPPGDPAPGCSGSDCADPGPSDSSVPVNRGLTWVKALHTNATGQDTVSCHDYPGGVQVSCNPYTGDTDCNEVRPILCIRQDGSASNGFVGSFYNGWAQGNIGITHGVQGTSLTSIAVADAECVNEFGAGWRMAEHHDGGGGWQWTAYGNINVIYDRTDQSHTKYDRFWVYINDQPGAPGVLDGGNCWD